MVKRVTDFQQAKEPQAELGAVVCSKTLAYQYRYRSRAFRQVAGALVIISSHRQMHNFSSSLINFIHSSAATIYSVPDPLERLADAYCDAVAGVSLLEVAF